jgi:uncharacterized phage-associated protein
VLLLIRFRSAGAPMTKGYDPRRVANHVISEARALELPVTNLKLQKLLFLCHAIFLVEKARPLVRGPFEAGQYGPVNREVYEAFRKFGGQPITELAVKINPATGMVYSIDALNDPEARSTISKVAEFYGRWRVTKLVELTHARVA